MRKLIWGLLLAIVAACNLAGSDSVVGTYVNHSEGEYSIADDTLAVSALDGEQFRVQRRTGFNLVRDGVVGKREFETEQWTLVFDKEMSAYREVKRGKVLHYDSETKALRIGNRVYEKSIKIFGE